MLPTIPNRWNGMPIVLDTCKYIIKGNSFQMSLESLKEKKKRHFYFFLFKRLVKTSSQIGSQRVGFKRNL